MQQALDLEWEKLVKKNAWRYETVSEWKTISEKAKKSGKKVHVGRVLKSALKRVVNCQRGINFANSKVERSG